MRYIAAMKHADMDRDEDHISHDPLHDPAEPQPWSRSFGKPIGVTGDLFLDIVFCLPIVFRLFCGLL